jgi:hypothetical protein
VAFSIFFVVVVVAFAVVVVAAAKAFSGLFIIIIIPLDINAMEPYKLILDTCYAITNMVFALMV